MKREIRKELNRISKAIENEEGISYGEIHFLQCHKEEIMELQDIVLAQWGGISEAEWSAGKLNTEEHV